MFNRILSLVISGSMILTMATAPSVLAKSKAEKEAERTEKVKAGIARLGVGQDTRVEVKLRDKRKLSGYVSAINDGSFAVTDMKTGATTEVAYPDVAQVKGHNLTRGEWIGIGILIGVVGLIVMGIIAYHS